MRWATFQIPPATTERIGVVRGDEIYAMAAGPKLIDLLGVDGMRWSTVEIPPASTERIGVVRGDEIYAMAAGPKLIDLLGDDGERLAAAGAKTLASPAAVVEIHRVGVLP